MSRRSISPSEQLRQAVECLPRRTQIAMLRGIDTNTIITGAYSDRDGGVCPMLAAHRCGGRTNFQLFATAWDSFTGIMAGRLRRRATTREIETLVSYLEESLYGQPAANDLGRAINEHQSLFRTRHEREAAGVGSEWLHDELLTVPEFADDEAEPASATR